MEELTIPTAWLDPRLRQVRDVLAAVMSGGVPVGLPIELRLAASAAFTEIECRSELPYPPAGDPNPHLSSETAVLVALANARNTLLSLIGDAPPEQGYGFAFAAREIAVVLPRE